jgi:hypothetical protein
MCRSPQRELRPARRLCRRGVRRRRLTGLTPQANPRGRCPSESRRTTCGHVSATAESLTIRRAAAQSDCPACRTIVQDVPCFSINTKPTDS